MFCGTFLFLGSCQNEDFVNSTNKTEGPLSLTAIFTSGKYIDKEAIVYTIPDSSVTDFVIPVPWYYPEDSMTTTQQYMTSMKVVAGLNPNCKLSPILGILDLTKKNPFTYTDEKGKSRSITISGQMTKSDKCQILSFDLPSVGVSGVVDDNTKIISLVSADNIPETTASYILSPHATISPDPTTTSLNYNDTVRFTVTANNGTTTAVYKAIKALPTKLASGLRSGSQKALFSTDITNFGVTNAGAIHPTLASIGSYVILDLGDGSTPVYLNKVSGSKVGSVALGSADPSGCVTSDLNGNMLISNYVQSGSTLKIYKTNSVTSTPTLYISYDDELNLPMGSRIHVQGDLNSNAIIVATCDGPGSKDFVRWVVTNGVVGQPVHVTAGVTDSWNGFDGNAKVVSRSESTSDGYFLGYYDGGNDNVYYCNSSNTPTTNLSAVSNGSAWGYNNGCIDTRDFNNAKFFVLYSIGYWPDWGLPATIYLYNVSSLSSFTGTVDQSKALIYSTTESAYTSIGYAGDGRTGDVLMIPSSDGYKLDIYYVDNTSLGIGGLEFDCINK